MSNLYGQKLKSVPARSPSPHIWTNPNVGRQYLEKLLEEKKKLAFYVQGVPNCNKLLDQEISRVSEMIPLPYQGVYGFERLQLGSPNRSNPLNMIHDVGAINLGYSDGNSGWSPLQHLGFIGQRGTPIDHGTATSASPSTLITKKMLRVDVPADKFPNVNFVGRLLGPKGNSLKRIEALTGCRICIRGNGSVRDRKKEERLRGRADRGHLDEPLHVVIEAESPANMVDAQLRQAQDIIKNLLKPEAWKSYKRQQFRELAMLKSVFKEDTSRPSNSSSAMKRSTAGWQGIR